MRHGRREGLPGPRRPSEPGPGPAPDVPWAGTSPGSPPVLPPYAPGPGAPAPRRPTPLLSAGVRAPPRPSRPSARSPGSRSPQGRTGDPRRAQGARSAAPPMGPPGARAAGAGAGGARGPRRRRRRRRRHRRGERSLGPGRAHCGRARALAARIPARDSAGAAGGSGPAPAQRPASGWGGGRVAGSATAGAASDRLRAEGGAAGGDEVMPSEKAPDVTCSQSARAARGQVTSAESRPRVQIRGRGREGSLPPPSAPCATRFSGTGS